MKYLKPFILDFFIIFFATLFLILYFIVPNASLWAPVIYGRF